MKNFLTIALLMASVSMVACSKSVDGASPNTPGIKPNPIGWDDSVVTREVLIQFQNTSADFSNLYPYGMNLQNPVVYQDSQGVTFSMIRLETTITAGCSKTQYSCADKLFTMNPPNEITIEGSYGGSCVYRINYNPNNTPKDYSLVGGDECVLSVNQSTKSLVIKELPGERSIKFYLQYQQK